MNFEPGDFAYHAGAFKKCGIVRIIELPEEEEYYESFNHILHAANVAIVETGTHVRVKVKLSNLHPIESKKIIGSTYRVSRTFTICIPEKFLGWFVP